jgi:hypothetical protein
MLVIAAALALVVQSEPSEVTRGWDEVLDTEIRAEWSGAHREYDFWIGEWEANWRGREEDGLHHVADGRHLRHLVFPVLGGKAIVELAQPMDQPAGEAAGRGFSIRYFDEARERWVMAQHWPNPQFDGVAFLDQLTGRSDHGRIMVYSSALRQTSDAENPTIRRYQFSDIAADRFRWDGANTTDNGASWTTWMVVDFDRTGPQPDLPLTSEAFPGQDGDLLCASAPHGALDGLEGVWTGTALSPDGSSEPARLTGTRMLDGCGILVVFERPESGYLSFTFWSYAPLFERWFALYLNNQPGEGHRYYAGPEAAEGAWFGALPGAAIADETTPFIRNAAGDASEAPARIGWTTLENDHVVFRVEVRGGDGEYAMRREYGMRRE